MKIALLTSEALPLLSEDDQILARYLQSQDCTVDARIWSQSDPSSLRDYDRVVIRSCWDYHPRLAEFLRFVDSLSAAGVNLSNSAKVVHWNCRKSYLEELERAGVAIVPTAWISSKEQNLKQAFEMAASKLGAQKEWVVKPVVSADGQGTFRLTSGAEAPGLDFGAIEDWMFQPYLPSIASEGELSLLYFGHELSHAVLKKPGSKDFRIQPKYGGSRQALPLSKISAELKFFGANVLKKASACLGEKFLYARVDLMFSSGKPVLGELELLEPALYFEESESSCARFFDALTIKK